VTGREEVMVVAGKTKKGTKKSSTKKGPKKK